MKRMIVLLFAVLIAMSIGACESSPDNYDPQDDQKDYDITTEYITGTFTVGNFIMTVPEGFSAQKTSHSYLLFSENSDCTISIFAIDLSRLDKTHVRQYIASQSKVFVNTEANIYSKKTQELRFGNMSVYLDMYIEETATGLATLHANGSFTDSWYGYTVSVQCSADSDNISEDFSSFGELCAYAKYIGKDHRFDFIQ